jgi:hypothetical protein
VKRVTVTLTLIALVMGSIGIIATSAHAYPTFGTTCVTSGCHTTPPEGDPSLQDPGTKTGMPTSADTTCAVTVSDVVSSYRGTAVIGLSAEDNADGWGVGYLYYKLDNGPARLVRVPVDWTTREGAMSCATTISVPAPAAGTAAHTISFWSQDNYGNVEEATTSTFTVAAPTTMPMPIRVSATSIYRKRPVTISGSVSKPGVPVVLYYKKPGASSYSVLRTLTASSTGTWSVKIYPSYRGSYYFKAKFAGDSEWLASSSTYKRVYVK